MLDKLLDLIRPAEPESDAPLRMIVGLGNPGAQYQGNRHNVGFQCVDLLAEAHGLRFDVKKGKAQVALGAIPVAARRHRVLLAKPQVFMNVSGQSVAALARFYQVQPAQLLVVYDELDLPLGRIRLRADGGAGGHNGIKSIIRELGSNQFPRLRVGIDRPPGRMDPAAYVLQDFSAEQEAVMGDVRRRAREACEMWLAEGIEATMNAFNGVALS